MDVCGPPMLTVYSGPPEAGAGRSGSQLIGLRSQQLPFVRCQCALERPCWLGCLWGAVRAIRLAQKRERPPGSERTIASHVTRDTTCHRLS